MKPARRALWFAAALATAWATVLLPIGGDAQVVLAILVFAMVVWVSEILPLSITGLGVSLLLILVAGMPATPIFAAYFDPVVVLLMGGFFLGVALSKYGLDVTLAAWVMRRAGERPAMILLALMVTTGTFSMWISNTAATAIMLPIALGIVAANPRGPDNLARALVLGVAFAANIGGIATPIGTTANPIALSFLAEAGTQVTFLGWMLRAVPLVILLLGVIWVILLRVYPLEKLPLEAPNTTTRPSRGQLLVMGTFLLTVALWLTTDLHGVSAPVVALVPIILLFVLGILDEKDIAKIGWPTLLLIGSGLALGGAVTSSGLDGIFADVVADLVGNRAGFVAFSAIGIAAVIMTILSSNTAAAVIMIPIVISLATVWDIPLRGITMLAAAALSLDFLVPVGTPPNAMAYGTGHVNVKQMAKAGSWATLACLALATIVAYWFW